MPKYHINPETQESSVCRARKKCPFGGEDDHFDSKKAAETYTQDYLAKEDQLRQARKSKTITKASTLVALESSLEYDGVLPEWFKSNQDSENVVRYPVKPKVIDVIDVNGSPAAVVWEEFSQRKMDRDSQDNRGYHVQRVTFNDFETGKEIGYFLITHVNEESLDRSFGTDAYRGLRWMSDSTGRYLGTREYDKVLEPTLEDKKKLWARAHAGMDISPEGFDRSKLTWGSLINLQPSDAPEDENKIDEDLQKLEEEALKELEFFKTTFKRPYVDFSRINDEYRGEGLGQALYVYGARMVGKKGHVLRESGAQSDEAGNAWKRMAADERLNVTIIDNISKTKRTNERKPKFALDFRVEDDN